MGLGFMSGLGNMASSAMGSIGDMFAGTGQQGVDMISNKNGAYTMGATGTMGQGAVPVTTDMIGTFDQAKMDAYTTALGQAGPTQGLGSKLMSSEGLLAAGQLYSGIKNMRRDDEKFEIAKRNNEEDREIAKERRAGRISLGEQLAR